MARPSMTLLEALNMNEEIEELLCSWCSGSGEGFIDGSACQKCKGRGTEKVEEEDEDI